ncbi:MAG: hypothetical protein KDB63_19885 [Nocardioidaceae bacterium]|nr:hypothetical protein [Nocardioidaceae bacterium]
MVLRRALVGAAIVAGVTASFLVAPSVEAAGEPDWTPPRDIPGTTGLVNPGWATAADGTDLLLWGTAGSGTDNIVHARIRLPGRGGWVDVKNRLRGSYLGISVIQPTPDGDFWAAYSINAGDYRTFLTRLDTSKRRWTKPVELFTDQPGFYHSSPQLSMTRDGTLVVSTYASAKLVSSPPVYRIAVGVKAPHGPWKNRFVTPAGEFSVGMDLAVNAKGDIVVGFIQGYNLADMTVRASTKSHRPGRTWKTATLSGAGDSQRASTAMTPGGTAVVAWTAPASGPMTAVRMATLETGRKLAPWVGRDVVTGAGQLDVQPYVVAGNDGAATVLWRQGSGVNVQLYERYWDGATLAPAMQLTPSGEDAELDALVRRPDGTALLVYQRFTLGLVSLGLEARVLDAGTATTPVTLTGDFATSGDSNSEQVGLDAAGRATLIYTHGTYPDTTFRLQTQATGPALVSGWVDGVPVRRTTVAGMPHVGRTVSCRTGFWVEKHRVRFAWTRDGHPIRGAGRHDYRIVAADKGHALACVATAQGGAADLVVPGKPRRIR